MMIPTYLKRSKDVAFSVEINLPDLKKYAISGPATQPIVDIVVEDSPRWRLLMPYVSVSCPPLLIVRQGRGPLPLLEETKTGLTSGYGGQFQGF